MNNDTMNNGVIIAGVNLLFNYAAGEAASRFLIALRDEKKIWGTRCPSCQRVLVPARSFCPRCFVDTTEWIEVGPTGTVSAFAPVFHLADPSGFGNPKGLSAALIRLDGADTALAHFIGETDAPQIGLRVVAVFAESRSGHILDIAYFKPA
ncbi:MAG: Zn-ribbon domain-containing OB-fold protein [Chloroflexi bacterium]|nr:Zn-ribbon domain-containing OB-fold protein [Chloroflexota bacterium]